MLAIDAERLVRDPLLELLPRIGVDLLVAQRARRFGEEEIDATEQSPFSSLRDWRIGLPTSLRQRARERLVHRDDALAERGDRLAGACAIGTFAHAGCAGARERRTCGARRAALSGGDVRR